MFYGRTISSTFYESHILEKGGEVPKTHSIRKLFGLLYQLTKEEVFNYDRKALIFLESAYLNSRYFNFVYEKDDASEASKIAEEVKNLVKNVRNDETNKGIYQKS